MFVLSAFLAPALLITGLLSLWVKTDAEAYKGLAGAGAVLLAANAAYVALPTKKELTDVYAVGAGAFLFALFAITNTLSFVPRRVMQVYGLGDLSNVDLVLDKQGCSTAQRLGASVSDIAQDSACRVAGARVLIRLGTQVVFAPASTPDSITIVLPRERVLGWTLPHGHTKH